MRRVVSITAAVLQIAAVVVFGLVVWQNATYRRLLHARVEAAPRFYAGDRLPRIPVTDLAGKPSALDLQHSRTIVAIVDPSCASCAKTMADARSVPDVKLVSLASADETRTAVQSAGVGDRTVLVGRNLPPEVSTKIRRYPQILLVDRGVIVRTCVSLNECRR